MLDYETRSTPRGWPTWIIFGLIPLALAVVGIVVICCAHASYYDY